jgi:hypothetical protein
MRSLDTPPRRRRGAGGRDAAGARARGERFRCAFVIGVVPETVRASDDDANDDDDDDDDDGRVRLVGIV